MTRDTEPYRILEEELIRKPAGWWERLCDAIPELKAMTGTRQPARYHAEGDVSVHTRLAVLGCPPGCTPDLRWAALLHDVGKPRSTRVDGDKVTSHGHPALGADMAEAILKRLGMPTSRIDRITWMIRHHMFHHSWNLSDLKKVTKRQKRYLKDPRFPLLLELIRIDGMASWGKRHPKDVIAFYSRLRKEVMSETTN